MMQAVTLKSRNNLVVLALGLAVMILAVALPAQNTRQPEEPPANEAKSAPPLTTTKAYNVDDIIFDDVPDFDNSPSFNTTGDAGGRFRVEGAERVDGGKTTEERLEDLVRLIQETVLRL